MEKIKTDCSLTLRQYLALDVSHTLESFIQMVRDLAREMSDSTPALTPPGTTTAPVSTADTLGQTAAQASTLQIQQAVPALQAAPALQAQALQAQTQILQQQQQQLQQLQQLQQQQLMQQQYNQYLQQYQMMAPMPVAPVPMSRAAPSFGLSSSKIDPGPCFA
eukprot:TRINITY_DN7654_c0_g1_i2.p1 TRINITY_DN7654_c0_g1~~TRINITY_DN7654_c0_g1_i2.p1  ORF type:complete len:185 (-),score=46.26 TRINITY_DN7654_c0_g1_i2:393-881(-)